MMAEEDVDEEATSVEVDEEEAEEGTGFEYFYCRHCQFRSCQGNRSNRIAQTQLKVALARRGNTS